jgi:tetratricopeptide (TPR) repeat protein
MKNEKRTALILHFQEINKLMEDQLEKWKSITEIRKTYDEFIKNLKKLKDLQPDLEKNLGPVHDELEEKREYLIGKIFPVTNILAVYISDNKSKNGARSMILGREEFSRLKHAKLLDFAGRMLKTTEKYFPDPVQEDSELSRYGLTPIMVDEFSTALTKYAYALKLSKDLLRNRSRSKKTSNRLLKANRELLEKRLDRLMTVFSVTHPSFYKDYINIRKAKVA